MRNLVWVLVLASAVSFGCSGSDPKSSGQPSGNGNIDGGNGGGGSQLDAGGDSGQGTGGSGGNVDGGVGPGGCVPQTCADQKKDCGPVADGCGGIVECGKCAKGEQCGIVEHNVCTAPADLCKPLAKADACKDNECGITGDGCGDIIDCGDCAASETCGLLQPFQCDPTPVATPDDCPAEITSCATAGAECGKIGNGCGGLLDCDAQLGGCPTDTFCGIVDAQQCDALPGCTPLTAAQACPGKCGLVSNGCLPTQTDNGLIDCDADPTYKCPVGLACGAGGVANQCGDPASGTCTPVDKATACGSAQCGIASDGCTGQYDCGSNNGMCGTDQLCQNGMCVAACTKTPMATACAGKECGLVSDGCNGTYTCGSCTNNEVCGQLAAYQCDPQPPATCTPIAPSVACAGKECGIVYDGCGTAVANRINCSTVSGGCTSGQFCGILTPFQCDAPPPPSCTSGVSCANMGWECGFAVDDCGNIYDCAMEGRTCNPTTETCVGGITGPTTCQTGSGGPGGGTCGVCGSIPDCTGQPQTTKLTGRVITPGKTDGDTANQVGVPNAFVYILSENDDTLLPAIGSGIPKDGGGNFLTACDRCDDQNLGPVLASATTDATGAFELSGNIPVNTEFVLVVKIGKWRRAQKVTLAAGAACATTALNKIVTRLPRTRTDGLAVNIPRIAISTGRVDAMECVFYKMGVAQAEFAQPGASGTAAQRIHMYASEDNRGQVMASGGSGYTNDPALYGSADRLNSYDMVVFDCESQAYQEGSADDQRVRNYVNRGGRMFASHWSYSWIADNAGVNYSSATALDTRLDTSANWGSGDATSATGYVSVNRPMANASKIPTFAAWLLNEGAVTQSGADYTFTITDPRDLAASVNTGSEEWVYRNLGAGTPGSCSCPVANFLVCGLSNCGGASTQGACGAINGCSWTAPVPGPSSVQQYSFNTPFGAPSADICGRVAYSGFHVAPAGSGNFSDVVFPNGCTGNLTAQEKVLLYMLFDLASCVTTGGPPSPPACTPLDPQTDCAGLCGTLPDGCGGTLDCGGCPSGQICNTSNTCENTTCTQTSCIAQGAECGSIADGCGGTLTCPSCPSGEVCGLFTPNQCSPTCTPTGQQASCTGKCGFVSDGCGGSHACGGCSGGLVCINNSCQPGSCTPISSCPGNLDCGVISDGCSGSVNCGVCVLPEVCGAGGMPNVCGQPMCNPLDCNEVGADCGFIGDGCGGSVDCGACPTGQVCGLGGPNLCGGCVPQDCADVGAECGQIGDGCGGSVDCGPCPQGKICGATSPNKCGTGASCKPQSCADASAECGLIGDGCGGVLDCGKCIATQVCGIKAPNQCNAPPTCTGLTCADLGADCGMVGDGCGDLVDCGPCQTNEVCGLVVPNKCAGVE